MIEKLKNFKWGYVLIGLFLAALGVCLISLRETLTVLAIAIGVVLILFALIYGTIVLAGRERGVSFAFKVIFAVICLVAGTVVAILHSATVMIMISLFSLLLIVDASFKLQTAIMSKRYSVALWWIILALAVAIITAGYFLIKADLSEDSIPTVSVFLGITIIIDAIANLLSAFYITIYEKRLFSEARNAVCLESSKNETIESAQVTELDLQEALPEPEETETATEEAPELDAESETVAETETVAEESCEYEEETETSTEGTESATDEEEASEEDLPKNSETE